MRQNDLFGGTEQTEGRKPVFVGPHWRSVPYQKKSETSRRSAEGHRAKFQGQRAQALEFVALRGAEGATNNEISDELGLRLSSVCSATNTLRRDGYLVDSGMTRKDLLTGRHCAVWEAVS